jgi:zinc D-Ala-D-Ala dipeptidase
MSSVDMVLLADPRIAAMPARDCGEELLDLRSQPWTRLDTRKADPAGTFAHLRTGVAQRLAQAQASLPDGLKLLVIEGYRPLALQRRSFDTYLAKLAQARPDWDPARLRVEASKFVAAPDVAPHATGGAVDLTLCTADGVKLDMGTAVDASPLDSANACFTAATNVSPTARRHRTVLVTALRAAGMVNYPTEWWHWSYGDRYWAFVVGHPSAVYAPIEWESAATPQSTSPHAHSGPDRKRSSPLDPPPRQ